MKYSTTSFKSIRRDQTIYINPAISGFSLVETMVASFILLTSVTAAVTLFNLTNTNARLADNKQDAQAAISEDLAAVLRLNDQFRCTSADSCSEDNFYPNENQYIGSKDDLNLICIANTDKATGRTEYSGDGFSSGLTEAVNRLTPSPRLSELRISRIATELQSNSTNSQPHLYSVAWTNDSGTTLRQVTLMPTIASWCP